MLKLAEEINEALGEFPVEFTQGELEEEVMIALDLLAHAYLETKQFDRAKQNYQKKLEVISALQSIDARRKGIATASTYHNLGLVAQELREWDDARHNYHQSLAICVEFGDKYSQASTYYQLGRVAEEVGDNQEAINSYLQDLAITAEFNNEHSLGISMRNLARFYKSTPDSQLLISVAEIFGASEAEVQQGFDSMDQGT